MQTIKTLILVTALNISLTLSQVQAVTLNMDDRQPQPADANFVGKTFLWEVNRTSDFNLNHLLGNLTGDYDGVRYSSKFNDAFYVDVRGVDSVGLPQYKYLQNFYVEGTDSNTEIFKMVAVRAGISPPPTDTNRHDYMLRTLNLDNIHLQVTDNPAFVNNNAMPELLIYDAINLNSSKLTMGRVTDGGNSPSELSFLGDHEINVTGAGNVIDIATATWNNTTVGNHSTSLNIADSSDLTIANGTDIFNEFNGSLSMGSGSTLTIDKSQVVLTSDPSNPKFKPSVIDNATVNITGTFGGSHASLQLTNPTIKNSTITLANNTSFRSYRRFTGGNTVGIVDFEGDNTINIGNGATFIGQAKGATTPSDGTFFFKNGTTTITGDTNANFQASDWFIDNATVNLNNISAETYVAGLTINNSTYKGRGFDFTNLSTLSVTDSTISGSVDFGKNVALVWLNNSSTIDPGFSTQSGGTEQYARGMTFNFAQAFWSGNNTFISNIDPNGTEVVVGFPATKNYSNQLFIKRANVTGFDTLNIVLNSADTALPASDYATGGELGDGVYGLVNLDNGATTDADSPTITLGGNMPALLTATQVKTPSADDQVSVQLAELPVQALVLQPSVTPAHQATTITQTVVQPGSGNTVQTQVTVTPNNNGSATQTLTTTTTTPGGGSSQTTNTSTLQPATGSKNLQNAANLLANSHSNGNGATINNLGALTSNQLASHLNSFHAEPYSSNITVALEQNDTVMNVVLSHASNRSNVSSAAKNAAAETETRWWKDASYTEGDVDGEKGLGSFEYSLTQLTIGADFFEASDSGNAGAFFSYGTHSMDEHDSVSQDADSDVYHLGLYLYHSMDKWEISGLAGYSYGDNESSRQVILANSSATPEANFSSHSFYTGFKAGYNWYENERVRLTPELGLNYIHYQQESFTESGDASLSLIVDKADAQAIIFSAGLDARFAAVNTAKTIFPISFVRFEHDAYANKNNEHDIKAALKSNPDFKTTFVGQGRGENAVLLGLGLASEISSNLQINGGLVYADSSHGNEWSAGVNIGFYW